MKAASNNKGGWWRRFMDWLLGSAREQTEMIEPELPAEVFVWREKK